jgi:hypothetical protein
VKRSGSPWRHRLFNALPSRELLAGHSYLQPLANRLLDPQLWRFQYEAVARGVAIGIFWAFLIPIAQIVAAAAHCVWWRANIPVAAGMTMLTNPFTIGFWLWLAYQLGAWLMGAPPESTAAPAEGALAWVAAFGWPTALGMGLFAVCGASLGYLSVKVIWRWRIWSRRRARGRLAV